MGGSGGRIQWIDAVRALGAVLVVVCHCFELIYTLYPRDLQHIASLNLFSRIFAFAGFTLGRFGAPLFLMISGYLLLGRTYDEESARRFWRGNCLKLFLCAEIWIVIYEIINAAAGNRQFSPYHLIRQMLFLENSSMNHIWYIPMILGMYLLLPLAANAAHSPIAAKLRPVLLIFTAYAFAVPTVEAVILAFGGDRFSSLFSMGFSGGMYGIYMIAGLAVKNGWLKRLRTTAVAVAAAVSYLLTVYMQIFSYERGVPYNVWYSSLTLLCSSVCLFELFSRIKRVPCYGAVRTISYYSFAIFLIHNIFITLLYPHVSDLALITPFKACILLATALSLSLISSAVIARIPKAGRFMLYLK